MTQIFLERCDKMNDAPAGAIRYDLWHDLIRFKFLINSYN